MMAAQARDEHDEPERMCAGCKQRDAQSALLRFAVQTEEPCLVPDPRRKIPGRGVSVHPTRECLRRAIDRGGFARAIGGRLSIDAQALTRLIVEQYVRRLEGLLLAARRSGSMALGTEAVLRSLDSGASLVLFAGDAAGKREEIARRAEERGARSIVFGTKSELGRLTGRDELGVLAILDPGIAQEVAATAARATDLSEAE